MDSDCGDMAGSDSARYMRGDVVGGSGVGFDGVDEE